MVDVSTGRVVPKRMMSAALSRLFRVTAFAMSVSAAASVSPGSGRAQDPVSDAPIVFNIPAQPLSRALIAYGSATGLEVFYKSTFAEGRQSREVIGTLPPSAALQELLRGTGYVAKTTGAGTFTIVQGATEAVAEAEARRRSYEPYFTAIQARVTEVLCRNASAAAAPNEVLLRAWLASSGIIVHAEALSDDGRRAPDQTFAAVMQGVAIGIPPPSSMPQPINMVIFPASKTSGRCGTAVHHRRGGQ